MPVRHKVLQRRARSAKQVLALSKEDLVRRTELEEETVEEVLDILRQEFE